MTLYPQRLVCIACQDHPDIQGSLSLKQFTESDHARWGAPPVVHATMEVIVDEVLEELGQSRRVALLLSSLTLLPGVVAKSNLLAVVPEHLALQSQETLPLQVLPLPFRVPAVHVSMTWHERMHNDPGHKWLRGKLRDIGQALSARAH